MTAPAPVGVDEAGEGGEQSEMLAPTVAVAVASVARPGVALLTVVFSLLARQVPSTFSLLASPVKWAIQ